MNPSYQTRRTCRLCGSKELSLCVPLTPTPIGDNYLTQEQLGTPEEVFNLDLMLCDKCGQVQLRDVVSPELLYPEFPYVTSVSVGLPEHFRRFAEETVARYQIARDNLVIEIGSNEGPMLRAFKEQGCRVLGIEPAKAIANAATASGVPTLARFFNAALARELLPEYGRASIIAAANVLANIDDLDDVFSGFNHLLAPDGLVVMETSYWGDVVAKGLIDTVYHEHITYFSVTPLVGFFARHGLQIIDVFHHANKGGSIRVTAQRIGGARAVQPSVAEFISRERTEKIHQIETSQACRKHLDRLRDQLQGHLAKARAAGRTIAGFGSSVGTTTMLYEFGLAPYLSEIFDDNQRKFGRFSPGLHLRCTSAEEMSQRRPDELVVFAWRFLDQIRKRHAATLPGQGKTILPLPKFELR